MTHEFDSRLLTQGVHFLPWVGPDYGGGSVGMRLLVLGEAHYSKSDEDIDFTRRLTRDYITVKMKHRFWTVIARTIVGQKVSRRECSTIWQSLAFYNYVQEIVGPHARVRPTSAMWQAARKPFLSVLAEVKPQTVLVVGKQLWGNLPEAQSAKLLLADGKQWPAKMFSGQAGASVLATFINHPASPGFSWKMWHPTVVSLRGRSS